MFREVITRACPLPPLLLLTRDRNTRASSLRGGREREREREREISFAQWKCRDEQRDNDRIAAAASARNLTLDFTRCAPSVSRQTSYPYLYTGRSVNRDIFIVRLESNGRTKIFPHSVEREIPFV